MIMDGRTSRQQKSHFVLKFYVFLTYLYIQIATFDEKHYNYCKNLAQERNVSCSRFFVLFIINSRPSAPIL